MQARSQELQELQNGTTEATRPVDGDASAAMR